LEAGFLPRSHRGALGNISSGHRGRFVLAGSVQWLDRPRAQAGWQSMDIGKKTSRNVRLRSRQLGCFRKRTYKSVRLPGVCFGDENAEEQLDTGTHLRLPSAATSRPSVLRTAEEFGQCLLLDWIES
jgi:hypothetical protein